MIWSRWIQWIGAVDRLLLFFVCFGEAALP